VKFHYVMTDLADKSIGYWKRNGYFDRFVNEGLLEFARFDASRDHSLTLQPSGTVISANSLANPLIVIANYILDSLPGDAFRVHNGDLQEVLLNVACDTDISNTKRFIKRKKCTWTYRSITPESVRNENYSKHPNVVLEDIRVDSDLKDPIDPQILQYEAKYPQHESLSNEEEVKIPKLVGVSDKTYKNYYSKKDNKDDDDDSEEYNQLLEEYLNQLKSKNESSFLFPRVAIKLLKNLMKLSKNRLMLVSADKGYTHVTEFVGLEDPYIEIHGSFSLMANIHALSLLLSSRGGFAFVTPRQDPDFKVVSLVLFDGADNRPLSQNGRIAPFLELTKLGGLVKESQTDGSDDMKGFEPSIIDANDYCYGLRTSPYIDRFNELRNTYRVHVEDFGPDHYFLLWKSVRTKDAFPSHILAQLRLSSHDPDLFFRYRNTLLEKIHTTPYREEILEELRLVWDNFYPNGVKDEDYIAFALGRIFFKVEEYKAALFFFEEALRTDPNDHATYYNIGLCKENLNSIDDALNNYNLCLANRPTFVRAVKRRERLVRILKGEEPDPVEA